MLILGLTGGMGCGKSTAARFFTENGFRTLDADIIVHELLANDEDVRREIVGKFGVVMQEADGGINRRQLGSVVFQDAAALEWLEQLLHPRVGKHWREATTAEPEKDWVVQIPLLFEKKLEKSFHFTVCISASDKTQQQRLLQRGLSGEEISRRLSRQFPITEKVARSDFFLSNDGSLDFLRLQVVHLCEQLRCPPTAGTIS